MPANAENRVTTLNGWFKDQYADAPVEAIPAQFKLQENVPFGTVLAQGNKYHVPLVLQYPSGVTYAGTSAGAFALNQAVAGATVDATVQGTQILLREAIDYESAKLASSSKVAFGQVTSRVVKSMLMTMRKRLEIEFLYGQMGIGTVSSATNVANSVITFQTAEWAAGIWAGSKGAQLEFWNSANTVLKGYATVVSVSLSARTVTVDQNVTLFTSAVGNNDLVYFKGAQGNECAGVHKILTNAGTLFGVSAATYELWAGSSFANGSAALTFTSLSKVMNAMYEKGCENDVVGLISHKAFTNLMNGASITVSTTAQSPLSQTRMNESGGSGSLSVGYNKISYAEQNGTVTLVPSTYVKEAYAYLLSKKDWMRIGATDVTFQLPDSDGKEFVRPMSDNAGFELRAWSHQAPFCQLPGRSGIITAIVNS
jgi:hypothetical protein